VESPGTLIQLKSRHPDFLKRLGEKNKGGIIHILSWEKKGEGVFGRGAFSGGVKRSTKRRMGGYEALLLSLVNKENLEKNTNRRFSSKKGCNPLALGKIKQKKVPFSKGGKRAKALTRKREEGSDDRSSWCT